MRLHLDCRVYISRNHISKADVIFSAWIFKNIFWDLVKSEVSIQYWGYPWLVSSSLFMNSEEFLSGHLTADQRSSGPSGAAQMIIDPARIASENRHWSHRPRVLIIKSQLILWRLLLWNNQDSNRGTGACHICHLVKLSLWVKTKQNYQA